MITITSRKATKSHECPDVVVINIDGKEKEFPGRDIHIAYRSAVNHLIINGKELHLKLGKPKAPPAKVPAKPKKAPLKKAVPKPKKGK